MKSHSIKFIFTIFFLFLSFKNYAQWQKTSKDFGQNRVQYKPFDWHYISTHNFDVYYYKDGYQNALNAIEIAENSFNRITDLLGYYPLAKTRIYLYNSNADLYQSNAGINRHNYSLGGLAVFSKSQVQAVYPGYTIGFRKDFDYSLARMFITDMLLGSSWREIIQGSSVLNLSEWFIDGAALYAAEGWSIEMDDYMREKLTNGNLKKFSKLKGREAALVGQSIWNFIAERYGKINMSNILNLARIIRKEESSIENTLGIPYSFFLKEWKDYYLAMKNTLPKETYSWPNPSDQIIKNRRRSEINEIKFNPSGEQLAYVENRDDRYRVHIYNVNTKKNKVILKGKALTTFLFSDRNNALISWRSNEDLGIIHSKRGKMYLSVHEGKNKKISRKSLADKFTEALSFNYSPDGKTIVASVNRFGKTDIYTYDIIRNNLIPITNDDYDDLYPSFLPGINAIVFSSNRINDTLRSDNINPTALDENFDIFIFYPDSTNRVLKRITNTLSKETKPIPINSKELLYLSDQLGITHLYKHSLEQNTFSQLSSYEISIDEYTISPSTSEFAFSSLFKGKKTIFLEKSYDHHLTKISSPTLRQEQLQLRILKEKKGRKETVRKETKKIVDVISKEIKKTPIDSSSANPTISKKEVNTDDYQFGNNSTNSISSNDSIKKDINTENYQFESSPTLSSPLTKVDSMKKDFLKLYKKTKKNLNIRGPYPYKPLFSVFNLTSSLIFHPIKGPGLHIETEMTDLLENHKIYGGLIGILDFKSGSLYAEYQYLKHRIDYKLRFERRGLNLVNQPSTIQKYTLNQIEAGVSYPFSNYTRISVSPFLANTHYNDLSLNTLTSPYPTGWPPATSTTFYTGMKIEAVFDNSSVKGLNIIEGTRSNIKLENYAPLGNSQYGFTKIRIDIRRYQKIHKEMIFATRIMYGKFLGTNTPKYVLGGMDNWIFKQEDNPTPAETNPLTITNLYNNSNILFAEYVTNLRGFNYNKSFGTDVLLLNAEWRFPISRYLSNRPINSNFIRNFQLIAFFDIGSTWTGSSPFSTESSINSEVIGSANSPFKAIVKNYKNPFLMGYGGGVRTTVAGYFLKFDLAWGVEDYATKQPKLYVTIGEDF